VLDACNKDTTVEKARETIGMVHRVGIRTWGYFIIGLAGETEATIDETIRFAKSIPLDIALFHVAVPYAGTDFYFQAVANGWLGASDWSHFDMNDSVVLRYPDLPPEAILAGTKRAFRAFYLRPRQILRLLRMLAAGGDVGMLWGIARGFLSWLTGSREDRIAAAEGTDEAPCTAPQLDAAAARSAVYGETVVESTHTDRKRTKPSHRHYSQVAGDATEI